MLLLQHLIRSNADSLVRCGKLPTKPEIPNVCNCGQDRPPSWRGINRQAPLLANCGKMPLGYGCNPPELAKENKVTPEIIPSQK